MLTRNNQFSDRRSAGEQLAKSLEKYRDKKPLVLGVPRGGVVVAAAVARELNAQLDVIVARKIGAPLQPEFAIGAVAPNDVTVLNEEALRYFTLSKQDLEELAAKEKKEMQRRINLFRAGKKEFNLAGRIVIIVDDGLATGFTALAAIRSAKKAKAEKIILAAPVCAADTKDKLAKEADEVVCMLAPKDFAAVGYFYRDFDQVTDEEVVELLKKSAPNSRGVKLV